MKVNVMLFGSLAEATGKSQINVENVADTESLQSKLIGEFPSLGKYKFVVAVCKQIVKVNTKLNEGDTVALLPPFAGG